MRNTLVVAIGAGLTMAVAAWWRHRSCNNNRGSQPKAWRQVGVLEDVWCFPIKSCGVIVLKTADCTVLGLKNGNLRDRVFMVTGLDNNFKTARTFPHMTQIKPTLEENTLTLQAPDTEDIQVDISSLTGKTKVEGKVWDQAVQVIDCGDEVAKWLSKYILKKDEGCRLVYYPLEYSTREVREKNKFSRLDTENSGALPDASSYMIINGASVLDLSKKLPEGSHCTPLHFRPNFVVQGANLKPYEEDNWRWVKIGETTIFECVKPCTRCIFTNIDPQTGIPDPNHHPLRTLKSYRQITDPELRPFTGDSPVLGVHLGLTTAGSVRVGDPVFVSE